MAQFRVLFPFGYVGRREAVDESKAIIRIMKTGKSYEIVVKKKDEKEAEDTGREQRKCLAGNSC